MKTAWTALLLLAGGAAAWAHDEKFSVSRIEVKDDGVTWSVDVALQGLEKIFKLPADPLEMSDAQFQGMKPAVVEYLGTCMKVEINGERVEPEAGALVPLTERFVATGEMIIAHARQDFRFPSSKAVRSIVLSGAFFATKTSQHHAVLNVSWGDGKRSYSRYGPFELELTASRVHPTFWGTVGEFLVWGAHHIFIGYDHVAFLLALLLAATTLGEMVRIATSFTLAHSLTLLLAAKEVLRMPSAVTESLIAASIVYVAVENYFCRTSTRSSCRSCPSTSASSWGRSPSCWWRSRSSPGSGRARPRRPPRSASSGWSGSGPRRSSCWGASGWWIGSSRRIGCRSRGESRITGRGGLPGGEERRGDLPAVIRYS